MSSLKPPIGDSWGVTIVVVIVGIVFLRGMGAFDWGRNTVNRTRFAGVYEGPLGHTVEFQSDGAMLETALLGTSRGAYRFLSDDRVEINEEGLLWGTNCTVFYWRFEGSTLVLMPENARDVKFSFVPKT